MIDDNELANMPMVKLRSLKFKIERRLHDLEVHYLRMGIAAKANDINSDTVTPCPYAIETEEATLWQEGYDQH